MSEDELWDFECCQKSRKRLELELEEFKNEQKKKLKYYFCCGCITTLIVVGILYITVNI